MVHLSQNLVLCQNIITHAIFIEGLAKKSWVTLASDFEMLSSLPKECTFQLIVVEIPPQKHKLMSILDNISARCPSPKIVLFNGNPDQQTLAEAFKHGVFDYFPKPVDYDLLLERAEALMDTI